MKRFHPAAALLLLLPMLAWARSSLPQETTTSTVFIARYNNADNFLGW